MPEFIEAIPAAEGRSLTPLVAPTFTSDWLGHAHGEGLTFGAVHALGVWAAEDLIVCGPNNFPFINGERFRHASIVPDYVERLIADGTVSTTEGFDLPERIIEEPVVAVVGWGQDVYGHGLIETAPKLKIAAKALAQAPEHLLFILPSNAPHWLRQIIDLAGARRIIEYDQARERLRLRRAWVATLPSSVAIHPACSDMFEEMRPPVLDSASDALFVTRRRASVTRAITMLNAEEIERIAERAGLRVVSPEQAPVAEQARLFANARLVVGEYGSGLMNSVFCQAGAVVGAIGSRSQLLSAISALRALRLSFFDPTGDPHDPLGYTVDADAFARWLGALLEAAAGRKPVG